MCGDCRLYVAITMRKKKGENKKKRGKGEKGEKGGQREKWGVFAVWLGGTGGNLGEGEEEKGKTRKQAPTEKY